MITKHIKTVCCFLKRKRIVKGKEKMHQHELNLINQTEL